MRDYLLLLPIIFIFHDMEEICGFIWFFKRNIDFFERFPKVMNAYRGQTHEGLAVGVYEEFIPFFGISLLAYYFPNDILYGLWYGLFLALTGHFLIHIGQTLYIRKYIPSFITSVICLPVSVIILYQTAKIITFDPFTIMAVPAAVLLMMINLKLCHKLAYYVSRKVKDDPAQSKALPDKI